MWNYTEKVMEHFLHPRNVGEIKDPDAVGEVGNITCGDALKIFLKLDADKKNIADVKFQTFGCASAIASASALTELVKGKPVDKLEDITNKNIADFLGELPEEKMHCSVMGMEALQAALSNLRGESDGKFTAGHDHTHEGEEGYDPDGLDRVVCHCFSVTERKIREVIRANSLEKVEDVTHYCKAGGGCGGCYEDIQEILDNEHHIAKKKEEEENGTAPAPMTNLQKIMKVQQVIEEEVRPGLQADGGNIELIDVNGDQVIVKLKGACAGCPSAHITLKRWVEAKLKEKVCDTLVVEEA